MQISRAAAYLPVFVAALVIRLACAAQTPFFADLPKSVATIESGRMYMSFPGYVPFHLLIASLSPISDLTGAFVGFSIFCGLVSLLYIMLTAELCAGLAGGVMAGAVAAFGLLSVYFSAVGSSYITDMLAVAGAIYHGLKPIQRPGTGRHILAAAAWCAFGVVLRPLSAMWMAPALIYLAWKWGTTRERSAAAAIFFIAISGGALLSFTYYGSLANVIASTASVTIVATAGIDKNMLVTALVRLVGFPIYFFHIWLVLAGAALFITVRRKDADTFERQALRYLLVMAAPYCFVLLRHLPQGGYLCYLAPIIILCPLICRQFFASNRRLFGAITIIFVMLSLVQIFLLRLVRPRTMAGAVADAYFLQYSRAGIRANMFETLSSIAMQYGLGADRIPEARRKEVLQQHRRRGETAP